MSFVSGVAKVVSVAALSVCATTVHPPAAFADKDPNIASQTQDSAEKTIADGYIAKQIACTPELSPVFESVTWDPPGFTPNGGSGMITDADPQLGGQFTATWAENQWAVEYLYC